MPEVTTTQGTIRYRAFGPDAPGTPTVVFVHGLLVDGRLWDGSAHLLAEKGIRSILLDLPLGAHVVAMKPDADLSFPSMARTVNEVLDALELTDVTLVGNDSGGAICQFLIDADHSRIGRLVLTNCDAFTNFPPFPFNVLVKIGSKQSAIKPLITATKPTFVRHSPLGFGLLAHNPDAELTRSWIDPLLNGDKGIRRDLAKFCAAFDPAALDAVGSRLHKFDKPVKLVWGTDDKAFALKYAKRLEQTFPQATLQEVAGATTFVSLDDPQAVADGIAELVAV